MEREEKILNFIDGSATGSECRKLIQELRKEGSLGEVLISEAAALFLYSREELLEYFSPAEVDEIEEMRSALTTPKKKSAYTVDDAASPGRMVAEEGEPYGK